MEHLRAGQNSQQLPAIVFCSTRKYTFQLQKPVFDVFKKVNQLFALYLLSIKYGQKVYYYLSRELLVI